MATRNERSKVRRSDQGSPLDPNRNETRARRVAPNLPSETWSRTMYIYIYIYIYIYMYLCVYTYYVCKYLYIYIYTVHVCTYLRAYVHIYIYIYRDPYIIHLNIATCFLVVSNSILALKEPSMFQMARQNEFLFSGALIYTYIYIHIYIYIYIYLYVYIYIYAYISMRRH